MTDRVIVCYHASCLDGFTAAWVACRALGGAHGVYVPTRYMAGGASQFEVPGRSPMNITEFLSWGNRDEVLFLDYCPSRDDLLRIDRASKIVTVVDHHKSAMEACGDLPQCRFDMDASGAGLAWKHFYGAVPPPWLVRYVEDRDLWRFRLPGSKTVNAFVSTFPMTFDHWNALNETTLSHAADHGATVLRFTERYVAEMADTYTRMMDVHGHRVPVINAPHIHISELVGHLANQDVPFAVGWAQRSDGSYVYSLRSRGDFDVSVLAKEYGGGGHKNSSGFVSPNRVF